MTVEQPGAAAGAEADAGVTACPGAVLSVVTAESEWKVIHSAEFGEEGYATPAIVDGRIYLRTSGHLYCFGQVAAAGQ